MNILLTKKLSQEQLDLIRSWGWSYEVVETLRITQVEVTELPVRSEAWVASSRNSFAAIKKFIREHPSNIYCAGDWMKNEIEKLGVKGSVKSFENMKSLAAEIAKQNFHNVIYFCGEEHRKELEEGLKNTKTKITKLITHKSEMTFPVINKNFDAIFVFSPRSAESLLTSNQFSSQTTFACIGSTTADYLRSRGITNTFIPSHPDSTILLDEFHHQALNI
jgi:uroporphyrinogen-III synthase